jgi:hypothetical protein
MCKSFSTYVAKGQNQIIVKAFELEPYLDESAGDYSHCTETQSEQRGYPEIGSMGVLRDDQMRRSISGRVHLHSESR